MPTTAASSGPKGEAGKGRGLYVPIGSQNKTQGRLVAIQLRQMGAHGGDQGLGQSCLRRNGEHGPPSPMPRQSRSQTQELWRLAGLSPCELPEDAPRLLRLAPIDLTAQNDQPSSLPVDELRAAPLVAARSSVAPAHQAPKTDAVSYVAWWHPCAWG